MADEGKIFSEKAVDMAKQLGREFKYIVTGMRRTVKAADDLQTRLEKMAKDSDLADKWDRTGIAMKNMAADVKEQLKNLKDSDGYNRNINKAMQRRVRHSKVITNMMGKQSKFNVARFKINKAILGVRTKLGNKVDQTLTDAYKVAEEERKEIKAAEDHKSLRERATDALWKQMKVWFSIGAILGTIGKMLTFVGDQITVIGDAFGVAAVKAGPIRDSLMESHVAVIGIGKDMSDVISSAETLASEFGVGFQEAVNMSEAILDSSKAMGLSTD